eukprot:TRINITY_DN410_c0_g1_i1.p2 TRINITY_DN410_c0_g1~~TRINITY_DN410_c0_g1_i1.p2  ORF type:complete len:166 (+),score=59.83 TRINITY_DN410_c0_g1_i1:63-560(+)
MSANEPTKESKGEGGGIMDGQMDWGENGGGLFEICNCSPCCGAYCCVTWWCCGGIQSCKLFSFALDQPCAIVNHCLPLCCLGWLMGCFMRHAVRTKMGVKAGGPLEGLVGDCICSFCCGPCSFCQELRGSHKMGGQESWDFFSDCAVTVSAPSGCKSFPPFTPMK